MATAPALARTCIHVPRYFLALALRAQIPGASRLKGLSRLCCAMAFSPCIRSRSRNLPGTVNRVKRPVSNTKQSTAYPSTRNVPSQKSAPFLMSILPNSGIEPSDFGAAKYSSSIRSCCRAKGGTVNRPCIRASLRKQTVGDTQGRNVPVHAFPPFPRKIQRPGAAGAETAAPSASPRKKVQHKERGFATGWRLGKTQAGARRW